MSVVRTFIWNLFNGGGGYVGYAEGETKDEIERLANVHLGLEVHADLRRDSKEMPPSSLIQRVFGRCKSE
jgi:hypothetical protein